MNMNGISTPVYLLRRLVNVISTLSVSNQYMLHRRKRAATLEEEGNKSTWMPEWRWMLWSTAALAPEPSVSGTDDPPPMWSSAHKPEIQTPPPRRPPAPPHTEPEPEQKPEQQQQHSTKLDTIHQLLINPTLFDPIRTPRYPIVLSHGLYGFDTLGPSSFPGMRLHYWSNVLSILRKTVGAEVIVTSAPGTGSIVSRSTAMDRQLQVKARGRGVNFLAHSMGGLDCRHLISHIKPTEYVPLSLMSVCTPHRGSPFMDWCVENIGIGKLKREELLSRSAEATAAAAVEAADEGMAPPPPSSSKSKSTASHRNKDGPAFSITSLPASFTSYLLHIVDSPAYANLTSHYLETVFNPQTPDAPGVKYFSVAGRVGALSVWHPLWLCKVVLDGVERGERERAGGDHGDGAGAGREWGNDGIVTVESAKWGEFLGVLEGCDHWEMRGARGLELGVELPSLPSIGLGGLVGARKKDADVQGKPVVATAASGVKREKRGQREREQDKDDALLKLSTEKMSSVFDWLVEQTPGYTRSSSSGGKAGIGVEEAPKQPKKEKGKVVQELASKADLERFYIALSRKLYNEGL